MKKKIKENFANQRLDVVLTEILKETRSQVQKIIKRDLILINGQIAKANYQLKTNDVLEIKSVPPKQTVAIKSAMPKIKVIAETEDYLVVNKPAGVLVHEASDKNELTLVDWLLAHCPEIKGVGDGQSRPGIVHRLDRDVSGLLVVAKNQASFLSLKEQFQKRLMFKEYQALVYGQINQDSGSINFLLSRASTGGKMAARPLNQTGKEALTEFEVAKHFINYTYLKLIIKTGRTHQIRAHLSAFGHPLVGDDLYSTKTTREKNKKLNLGRIWLFASRLAFADLAGEKQEFKLAIPKELKEVLDKVK